VFVVRWQEGKGTIHFVRKKGCFICEGGGRRGTGIFNISSQKMQRRKRVKLGETLESRHHSVPGGRGENGERRSLGLEASGVSKKEEETSI